MSDLSAMHNAQQAMWASGDYARVAAPLLITAENLCEAVDLRAGERVLDIATGSGNAALAAARRRCAVTGIDYVPALLACARERAAAERLELDLREGDAEHLPFADASFDVVLSTFGVMFAADQEQAARELLRVCRPGGRIGLACWTPEGFVGQWFRLSAGHAPPPPGAKPPLRWGTETGLRELLPQAELHAARRHYVMRYRSAEEWLDYFRTYFGPMRDTFASLDGAAQRSFADALLALVGRFNRSGDATLVLPGEYLEIVGRKHT